jgi:hypothetical protein
MKPMNNPANDNASTASRQPTERDVELDELINRLELVSALPRMPW